MKRGKSLLFILGEARKMGRFGIDLETQVVFEHTDPRGGNSMGRIPEAKQL